MHIDLHYIRTHTQSTACTHSLLIWLITWGPYEVVLWSHYSACKYADYPREVSENIQYISYIHIQHKRNFSLYRYIYILYVLMFVI